MMTSETPTQVWKDDGAVRFEAQKRMPDGSWSKPVPMVRREDGWTTPDGAEWVHATYRVRSVRRGGWLRRVLGAATAKGETDGDG